MNRDFNFRGVTGERFVNRIVDHFVDELVEPFFAVRSNIHGRTQAHGLHPLEDFYIVGGVCAGPVFSVFSLFWGSCCGFFNGHSNSCPGGIN